MAYIDSEVVSTAEAMDNQRLLGSPEQDKV